MTQKTVIITGANGLLGRQLVELLSLSWKVIAIVQTLPSDPIDGVQYKIIDLSGDWDLSILPQKVHAIIHLAQSAHFRDVPSRALAVFEVNIRSTAKILDYAWRVGASSFIYASSGGIYGGGQAYKENSPITALGELGYYLGSKVSCEALASSYTQFMCIIILRFFFIYGKRQNRSMLIPRLCDTIRDGRLVKIQGKDGLLLNPIHVTDAALAVVAALDSNNSATYNIAGPEVISLRKLCSIIEKIHGKTAQYELVRGEPLDVIGDITLMRSTLHDPQIKPSDGIRELI